MKLEEKRRTIYWQCLTHRLVATYFIGRRLPEQTVVSHLDYNKLNNRVYNLRWMTPEENYAHQNKSPFVISEKDGRTSRIRMSPTTKLSVTKVMLLKKLLNQNKPINNWQQFR